MRYSKTLAKFCNEDKRMETGSYFFDSDGHWALTEGENYSMDDVEDFLNNINDDNTSL